MTSMLRIVKSTPPGKADSGAALGTLSNDPTIFARSFDASRRYLALVFRRARFVFSAARVSTVLGTVN